jgi:hypothetical protein
MQFALMIEHSPELCPMANARTREAMRGGAGRMPELAQHLGVTVITWNVLGPDHLMIAIVEADDIEKVRDFVVKSGLIQWNTTRIHATWSLEEALAKADTLEPIF